jgi:hypothetical protein
VALSIESAPIVLDVREYKGDQIVSASQAKTSRALMKLLKIGISALPLSVTATVGLTADYEIFGNIMSVATGENYILSSASTTRIGSAITAPQSSTPRPGN